MAKMSWTEMMTREPNREFCKTCLRRTIPTRDPHFIIKDGTFCGVGWRCRVCGTDNNSEEIQENFDIICGTLLKPKTAKEATENVKSGSSKYADELQPRRGKVTTRRDNGDDVFAAIFAAVAAEKAEIYASEAWLREKRAIEMRKRYTEAEKVSFK
nr:hypothetical protein MarQu_422 [Marseillevirus sp.]